MTRAELNTSMTGHLSAPVSIADHLAANNDVADYAESLVSVPDVSLISAAVTLDDTAFGKMLVVTGTSTNYTIILPTPASGNTKKTIAFVFDPALTKFVTVNGKPYYANETVVLQSIGSAYRIVNGRSRPLVALMRVTANQSVASGLGAPVKLNLDGVDTDNSLVMANTSQKKITIPRAGYFNITLNGMLNTLSSGATRVIFGVYRNGTQLFSAETFASANNEYPSVCVTRGVALAANDVIELYMYHNATGDASVYGSANGSSTSIEIQEIPQ